MLLFQAFLCTVGVMASVVASYKLDFYDGPVGTGCESDQLVQRDTWSGDASAECTPFQSSDEVKYVRIAKNDKTDDEYQVLFSNSDDCSETNAVRLHEGCFEISKTFPDIRSYRVVPHNNHINLEKVVDSRWASSDSWSSVYIWMTTAAGITAVNAIRSSHGEKIASTFVAIGRPLWAFVSSRFISSIWIGQVIAVGASYLKQHWPLGKEIGGSCEKSESKLDVLTQIIAKVTPMDDIESINAVVNFKDGRTMTIRHPAVNEKVK